jgi:hypothetical protein
MTVRFDEDMRNTIMRLRADKTNVATIASKIGVSSDTLYKYCRNTGIPIRNYGDYFRSGDQSKLIVQVRSGKSSLVFVPYS